MTSDLIAMLTSTRATSRSLLKGIDPNMVVYAESGWRTRDLIGHMTDWDIEAVRGLQAFVKGEVYEIPNFTGFDAYNHPRAEARWNQPVESVFADWEANHEALKEAVRAVPAGKLDETMRYPWCVNGPARWMVRIMGAHEHEHVEDIVNAARRNASLP